MCNSGAPPCFSQGKPFPDLIELELYILSLGLLDWSPHTLLCSFDFLSQGTGCRSPAATGPVGKRKQLTTWSPYPFSVVLCWHLGSLWNMPLGHHLNWCLKFPFWAFCQRKVALSSGSVLPSTWVPIAEEDPSKGGCAVSFSLCSSVF